MRKLAAFPRSNNPIFSYTFRFPLWSCQLEQACNLLWCFITSILTSPHWRAINGPSTFLCRHRIDPYIRGFRQLSCKHSNLGYLVDLRPMGNTIHLWMAFVGLVFFQHFLRLLSAVFTELLTADTIIWMPVGVLRGRFRALPHHSTSRIVSSPNFRTSFFC